MEDNSLFCSECGAKCDNNIKFNGSNKTENNDSFNFIKALIISFPGAIISIIIGYFFVLLLNHFDGFLIGVVITTVIFAASNHANDVELAIEGMCTGFITTLLLFILFTEDFVTIIVMLYRLLLYTFAGLFVGGAKIIYGEDDDD